MDTATFERSLLDFIGRLSAAGEPITPDTPLLERGIVDSKRVMELMAFVEGRLGITVPDDKLSMEFFRTPRDIVRQFVPAAAHVATRPQPAPPPAPPPLAAIEPAPPPPLLAFSNAQRQPSGAGLNAMVERGEIMPDDNGCVAFRGPALALHGFFTRLFANEARRERAMPRRYPTLVPLAAMQRTDYFKSFPQHATFCTCLDHDTSTLQAFVSDVKAGRPVSPAAGGRLEAPALALNSALCYHCYREYGGRVLDPGLTLLSTEGRCFRNERGAFRTLDRCYEFTMSEIVMLGDPAEIDVRRLELLERTVGIAKRLGLGGTVECATDMFFRGDVEGRARMLHQRANALKYELRIRMDEAGASLAVASFNLHEDYFGRHFDIRLHDGTAASTGCVAFGIERWVSAFLAYHGADPAAWPHWVREDVDLAGPAYASARKEIA